MDNALVKRDRSDSLSFADFSNKRFKAPRGLATDSLENETEQYEAAAVWQRLPVIGDSTDLALAIPQTTGNNRKELDQRSTSFSRLLDILQNEDKQRDEIRKLHDKFQMFHDDFRKLRKLETDVELLLQWRLGMRKWKEAINGDLDKLEARQKTMINSLKSEAEAACKITPVVQEQEISEKVLDHMATSLEKVRSSILATVGDEIQANTSNTLKVIGAALSLAASQSQQARQELMKHVQSLLDGMTQRITANEEAGEEVKQTMLEFTTRFNSSAGGVCTTAAPTVTIPSGLATVTYVDEIRDRIQQAQGSLTRELRNSLNGRAAKEQVDQLENYHRSTLQSLNAKIGKRMTEQQQGNARLESALEKITALSDRIDNLDDSSSRDELLELQKKIASITTRLEASATVAQVENAKSVFETGLLKMATCFDAYATKNDLQKVDAELDERTLELRDIKTEASNLREKIDTKSRQATSEVLVISQQLAKVQAALSNVTADADRMTTATLRTFDNYARLDQMAAIQDRLNETFQQNVTLNSHIKLTAEKELEILRAIDILSQHLDELERNRAVFANKTDELEMKTVHTANKTDELEKKMSEQQHDLVANEVSTNELRQELIAMHQEMKHLRTIVEAQNVKLQQLQPSQQPQQPHPQIISQQTPVNRPRRADKYFGPEASYDTDAVDYGSRFYMDLVKESYLLPEEASVRELLLEDGRQLVTILRTKKHLVAKEKQLMKPAGRHITRDGIGEFKKLLGEVAPRVRWQNLNWPFVGTE